MIEIYGYHGVKGTRNGFWSVDENDFITKEYSSRELYLGAEVEVDWVQPLTREQERIVRETSPKYRCWNTHELADELEAFLKLFVVMTDSSLQHGAEFVSAPMSLEAWIAHKEKIACGFEALRNAGLRAHDTNTCGLHVHVSRDFFRGDSRAWSNLLVLVERNWPAMAQFARRPSSTYAPSIFSNSIDTIDSVKNSVATYGEDIWTRAGDSRRMAVNYQNPATIEFRFFKGTLNVETFYATLQLVNNMCNIAALVPMEVAAEMDITQIIEYADYPELRAYAKKRKFGINSDAEIDNSNLTD
jgi:hypothetical protein